MPPCVCIMHGQMLAYVLMTLVLASANAESSHDEMEIIPAFHLIMEDAHGSAQPEPRPMADYESNSVPDIDFQPQNLMLHTHDVNVVDGTNNHNKRVFIPAHRVDSQPSVPGKIRYQAEPHDFTQHFLDAETESTRRTREAPVEKDHQEDEKLKTQQVPLADGNFVPTFELVGDNTVTCPLGTQATYIRIPRAMAIGVATTVASLESVTCAQYCGNNSEPTSGAHRLCQGFNYIDSSSPTCELYDQTARISSLSRNVGTRSYYYDKVCLQSMHVCKRRSFAFECLPDAQLSASVARSVQASSFSDCLSRCLDEKTFVCQSVNYIASRRGEFKEGVPGVQYCENNCLTSETRCLGGSVHFIKTLNSEVEGFDATVAMERLTTCLQKCLESDFVFCRSVEYDRNNKDCVVSDEDTHSVPEMVQAGISVNVDLYEPICLVGQSSARIGCNRPYLYEKILNTALQTPGQLRSFQGATLEQCLLECSNERYCKSVNYNKVAMSCSLVSADRRNSSTALLVNRQIDFYESNCNQAIDDQDSQQLQGCFFALEETGRQIRRDFRSDEMAATTAIECKMNCIHEQDCLAISYSRRNRRCLLSQLDSSHVPFYLLTEVQPGFDTYTKRQCVYHADNATQPQATTASPTARIFLGERHLVTEEPFNLIGCHFRLESRGRRIKEVYRNDQVVVPAISDCQLMCGAMMSYDCRTVSFNPVSGLCYLSELDTINLDLNALTERDAISDIYLKHQCIGQTTPRSVDVTAITRLPSLASQISSLSAQTLSPNGLGLVFRETTSASRFPTIQTQEIQVDAFCMREGVNVSVTMPHKYTGAIYSAERFSLCRNLISGQSSFWLFLPMPTVNTACNTVLQENKMNGVVVISMDGIIPYDVTTKEDMFYQVTCDIDTMAQAGNVMVTGGLVIAGDPRPNGASFRGPRPRVVVGSGIPEQFVANLQILKHNSPVQSVLLGEQLTLRISSNVAAQRMMLMNCNVSRVGGTGPLPDPLSIIDHGCPVVDQVVGPVLQTPNGLETNLVAFRIDGSAEIQIVCMVQFCARDCNPALCADSAGASTRSFGRRKRDITTRPPENLPLQESVNGRLKVYVQGEDGVPDDLVSNTSAKAKSCIDQGTFIVVSGILSVMLVAALGVLACIFFRRLYSTFSQTKSGSKSYGRKGSYCSYNYDTTGSELTLQPPMHRYFGQKTCRNYSRSVSEM